MAWVREVLAALCGRRITILSGGIGNIHPEQVLY
jgi:hypothetical protein